MFNIFCNSDLRKSKQAELVKRTQYENYNGLLTEALSFMFEREGLPKELEQNFIEPLLLEFGVCAVWKSKNGEYVASFCSLGGEPYADGLGSLAVCSTLNGEVKEFKDWRNNPNVCVMFNNITKTNDLVLEHTASMLSEIDTSIKLQLKHSRLYPIPIVRNAKEKEAIKNVLSKIDNGEQDAVVSDNVLDDVFGKEGRGVYTVDMTRPEMADHIQYLTHAKDDVWRFWWQLYGMNSQGTSKMAQQSVEEVSNNDCASLIIPLERLKQRKLDTKILNEKFGWNSSVDFSEAWRARVEKAEEPLEGTTEETVEESVEESVEEPIEENNNNKTAEEE